MRLVWPMCFQSRRNQLNKFFPTGWVIEVRGAAEGFPKRRDVGGDHGATAGQRFQWRQAISLVHRSRHKRVSQRRLISPGGRDTAVSMYDHVHLSV